jgi:hypothetical protein
VTDGPPPVPGGRSPEDREAARRERAARRAAERGEAPPAPPPPRQSQADTADWLAETDTRDWRAEAERLTAPPGAMAAFDGDGGEPPAGGRRRFGGGAPRRPTPRWGRLVALGVALAVLVAVGWFLNSLFQPFKGDGEGEVQVVIPQGSSLGEIADLLEDKGVVSSSSFFQLRARLAGRSDELKPGRYTLARDMSFTAVLDKLEQGLPPNVVRVVIPEGLSRK